MTLTRADERLLVGLSLAAGRPHLRRVAAAVLQRGDRVAGLLLTAGDTGPAWAQVREVLVRRGGDPFQALDLITEAGQQAAVRRGEPRTWEWPPYRPRERDE